MRARSALLSPPKSDMTRSCDFTEPAQLPGRFKVCLFEIVVGMRSAWWSFGAGDGRRLVAVEGGAEMRVVAEVVRKVGRSSVLAVDAWKGAPAK